MPSAPLEPKWKQQFRARMGVPAAAAEYSAADNDEESSPPPPPPPATSDADDVIIPDDIARPLVYSSWLLFATSVAAGLRGEAGLSLVTFLVFVTSILHWSSPRFSSWRRYADYFAVVFAIVLTIVIVLSTLAVWTTGRSSGGMGSSWTLWATVPCTARNCACAGVCQGHTCSLVYCCVPCQGQISTNFVE